MESESARVSDTNWVWRWHRRRLFKMTAAARFESPIEWPKATRDGVWGGGVPLPIEGGVWGGGCAPSPEFFFEIFG